MSTPSSVPKQRALAAGQACAAQHDRGDRGQFQPHGRARRTQRQLRGDEDAGDAGEEPTEHVDPHQRAVDTDAGQPRRFGVAADGKDIAAKPGVGHDVGERPERRRPGR